MTNCSGVTKRASKGNITQPNIKRLQNKPQQATGQVKGMVIDHNWRIGADTLNIILYQRQVSKTGKEYWRAHSYYADVANALVELVNQGVRDTGLADLKMVCDKIDQLRKDILEDEQRKDSSEQTNRNGNRRGIHPKSKVNLALVSQDEKANNSVKQLKHSTEQLKDSVGQVNWNRNK